MNLLLNFVKLERIKQFPKYEQKNDYEGFIKRFDHRYLVKVLQNDGNTFLDYLALHKSPTFEKTLIVNWASFQITLFIPDKGLCRYMETLYGIQTVITNSSWTNFFSIITALLNEHNLVFVHEDRQIIDKYMLFNKFLLHQPHQTICLEVPPNLLYQQRELRIPQLPSPNHNRR